MDQSKTKILIIEDESILVEVLSKKLEQEGFSVFSAENGQRGLEEIDRINPDLILLDIVMPKLNGYEVLEALQGKLGKAKMPPIIIISNSGQPVEIDKALNLGASDYIVKAQFTPEEVIGKVRNQLGQGDATGMASESKRPSPATDQKAPPANDKEARVLIVEDDQFLRDLLTTKLEKENFDVVSAIDGPGGIEKIISEKADVVLLDIILPEIDGFEILKRIRSNAQIEIASVPIILLSNLGQEADVEKGRILGADDYLIKSNFTIDEIIEKIRHIISLRKQS